MWQILVLDQGNQPINVISLKKAAKLLLKGKAQIVEEYEDSPQLTADWRVPSIIRLIVKIPFLRKSVQFSRFNVLFRDDWTCQYCRIQFKTEELTYDHVIPKCARTPDSYKSWENIVMACYPCNQRKAGRTPAQAGMKLLRQPKQPKWVPQMTIRLTKDSPASWRDYVYWHGALQT